MLWWAGRRLRSEEAIPLKPEDLRGTLVKVAMDGTTELVGWTEADPELR